jgi:HK97 family phage major capsid protein
MGATRLSGLQGSVTVPKQTAPGTGYWLATEATGITESQMVIGQLALSPKNVGAYTEISRQLLLQSSPDAEMLVMNDLAAVVGLALDTAALTGPGTGGQPTGITVTTGIGSVTITTATVTYANVLEFQTDAASGNALAANSGYVTTPVIASILKQKARFSNTDTPIWQGNILDGNIESLRAVSSNQITAGQLMFGDFSQVVIGEWGVLEVEANPYANFAAGIVGVRAFYSVDVGVRYPAAFSLGTGITA